MVIGLTDFCTRHLRQRRQLLLQEYRVFLCVSRDGKLIGEGFKPEALWLKQVADVSPSTGIERSLIFPSNYRGTVAVLND